MFSGKGGFPAGQQKARREGGPRVDLVWWRLFCYAPTKTTKPPVDLPVVVVVVVVVV